MAGTNGKMTSFTTDGAGNNTVTMSFDGPPPDVETYDPVSDKMLATLQWAETNGWKVDTSGTEPTIGTATVHK